MVKLASVQFESSPDYEENVDRASVHIKRAAHNGAKLVCLPEYFFSNLSLGQIVEESAKIDRFVRRRMDALAKTLGLSIVYNVPRTTAGKMANTCVLASGRGELGAYSKTCLFPNKPFKEVDYFQRGNAAPVFDCGFAKIGIAICYDLRFPELFRELALDGADLVLVPSAFPLDKLQQWRTLLMARAIENQIFIAGVNKTGQDSHSEYAANTLFVSPRGSIMSQAKGRKEQIVYADVRLSEISRLRKKVSYLKSAKIFY